jgi:hypothetical protein
MTTQAPIKVSEQTKQRIRYLAALSYATQGDIVDRAVSEYAARHAGDIAKGMERARTVLAGGDTAIAAHLLGEPLEAIERVTGKHKRR